MSLSLQCRMLTFVRICFLAVFLVSQITAQESATPEQRGAELFTKKWTEIEYDTPNPRDGLGPMFNAESCVACHNLNGRGGAGDNSTNVQHLTVLPRQNSRGAFRLDDTALALMFRNAEKIHPSFKHKNSIVLHRSSTKTVAFENWQRETLEFRSLKKVKQEALSEKLLAARQRFLFDEEIYRVRKSDPRNRFTLQISRRNTPLLFGVGTIDQISDDDIQALEKQQAAGDGPAKGVASHVGDRIGKFGWRGQHASVRDFTVEACAVELGLANTDHRQPIVPFEDHQLELPQTELVRTSDAPPIPRSFDMTKREIEDLNSFVVSLPAPMQKFAAKITENVIHDFGQQHFIEIGCAQCHVENVGPAFGVYSDFLLHDMGSELADAADTITKTGTKSRPIFEIANDQLWQTPPLWRTARSAPYMHDGRAKDLRTAILMHKGEATFSAKAFAELNHDDKDELLFFLDVIGNGDRATVAPQVFSGGWSSGNVQRGRLVNGR